MIGSVLQRLIRKNYHLRRVGIKKDQWYWADRLYLRIFGMDEFYLEDFI